MSAEKAHKPLARPGKDVIYADVDDEITSIIDKVEAAKEKVVALVLPKRFSALQSIVNMRLLKRASENAGKNVVLITGEAALLPLAGAAGFHVAKTLQSKPEIPPSPVAANGPEPPVPKGASEDEIDDKNATLDYHRSIGELAAVHALSDDDAIPIGEDSDELPEPKAPKSSASKQAKDKKLKVPNFDKFRLFLFGGIGVLILLIIFIIMAIFVLPKANVTLQTASSPIAANLTLNASDKYTSLNEDAKQIPASLKATKQTSNQQVPATGQQNNGDKASGSVTLSNCTNSSVSIPAGTGVSSNGLTYITQKTLSLDSGNFTSGGACKSSGSHVGSVNVLAQTGGAKYNIGSGSFSVSGYPGVNGSGGPMSGGTDNITTVVSQTDIDNAKQKASSSASADFTKQFMQQLSDQGYYVIASTLKGNDPEISANPAVGQAASNVSVTVTTTYTVLAVQKADLKKIITDNLNDQIDKSKQKISADDVLKGASVTVQNQTAPAAASLNVSEETTAIPIIDVNQVKKIAAGQKKGDIEAALSGWPGVKKVTVSYSPFWVSKAPKNPAKVTVVLQQVKD